MKKRCKKVNGIKLLKMISKGKIKEGTKIYCSDFPIPYYFEKGTLLTRFNRYELSLKDYIKNINYATYTIDRNVK